MIKTFSGDTALKRQKPRGKKSSSPLIFLPKVSHSKKMHINRSLPAVSVDINAFVQLYYKLRVIEVCSQHLAALDLLLENKCVATLVMLAKKFHKQVQ